jgi:hypothetical protein
MTALPDLFVMPAHTAIQASRSLKGVGVRRVWMPPALA